MTSSNPSELISGLKISHGITTTSGLTILFPVTISSSTPNPFTIHLQSLTARLSIASTPLFIISVPDIVCSAGQDISFNVTMVPAWSTKGPSGMGDVVNAVSSLLPSGIVNALPTISPNIIGSLPSLFRRGGNVVGGIITLLTGAPSNLLDIIKTIQNGGDPGPITVDFVSSTLVDSNDNSMNVAWWKELMSAIDFTIPYTWADKLLGGTIKDIADTFNIPML